jgi:hypothetical protein
MSHRSIWIALWAAGAAACISPEMTAASPAQEPAAAERAGTGGPISPDQATLEITSADGKWYVDLAALDLGPVRLPLLGDPRSSAILLSARSEGDKLILSLAAEKGELETSLIGRYELHPAKGAPLAIPELESWKTGAWTIRVVHVGSTLPGCCSCTPAFGPARLETGAKPHGHPEIKPPVQCCPNTGRCMGCGTCGTCCG